MWTDSRLPDAQTAFLSDVLRSADRPCVILVHECLDPALPDDHLIRNAEEIRTLLSLGGKVSLVVEGHYHPGADHTDAGIRYLTVPALCEREEAPYTILDL